MGERFEATLVVVMHFLAFFQELSAPLALPMPDPLTDIVVQSQATATSAGRTTAGQRPEYVANQFGFYAGLLVIFGVFPFGLPRAHHYQNGQRDEHDAIESMAAR